MPTSLNHEFVWEQWFGDSIEVLCPICEKIPIFKDQKPRRKWHVAHFKATSLGGKDVYPNAIPSCEHCNTSMYNIHIFDYMVKIGRISHFDSQIYKQQLENFIASFDPRCNDCMLQGRLRPNRKKGMHATNCEYHSGVCPMVID